MFLYLKDNYTNWRDPFFIKTMKGNTQCLETLIMWTEPRKNFALCAVCMMTFQTIPTYGQFGVSPFFWSLRWFFTDSTIVNHHFSRPFGRICSRWHLSWVMIPSDNTSLKFSRWWQLKHFFVQPDPWGFMIQFDEDIFFKWVGSTTN